MIEFQKFCNKAEDKLDINYLLYSLHQSGGPLAQQEGLTSYDLEIAVCILDKLISKNKVSLVEVWEHAFAMRHFVFIETALLPRGSFPSISLIPALVDVASDYFFELFCNYAHIYDRQDILDVLIEEAHRQNRTDIVEIIMKKGLRTFSTALTMEPESKQEIHEKEHVVEKAKAEKEEEERLWKLLATRAIPNHDDQGKIPCRQPLKKVIALR